MMTQSIEKRLIQAIQDPKFSAHDRHRDRPAYDYTYEGFWPLVVSSEIEE